MNLENQKRIVGSAIGIGQLTTVRIAFFVVSAHGLFSAALDVSSEDELGLFIDIVIVLICWIVIMLTTRERDAMIRRHAEMVCIEYPGIGKLWRNEVRRLTPYAARLSDADLFPARRTEDI